MTPKQFYHSYKSQSRAYIEYVCKSAGTSYANFQQIAIARGAVGKRLAKRLAEASQGQMTAMEILYPEDFEDATD